jgi:conjugative relaxase-like TrwC/TraI family protein
MLRIREIANAGAAKDYYRQSDYYLEVPGDWLGRGAERLGLTGRARQEDFEALCDNLNPAAGGNLTAKTVDGRRVGWDFNFNSSKSVGIALELTGDMGILKAHRDAVEYAMAHVEDDMLTRVRAKGKDEDRLTGNIVAMRVTHRTTRPNEDDKTPDMELHDHVVVFNATFDDAEDKWKAAQIGQIKHDAPYYEAIYHNRLAANLRGLGYGIRRKGTGFEIAGISDELIGKYSRRKAAIEKKAAELGIHDAEAKARLGATTRLGKIGSRIEELTAYWDSKLTRQERRQLKRLKGQPSYQGDTAGAVEYAIGHLFERQSVVDVRRLYETAIRHGIGFVEPDGVAAEAQRQGLLVRCSLATTQRVLDQEEQLISFARLGRGTYRPLGAGASVPETGLSAQQKAIVRHIWESPDRVIMIEGDAGTGKTEAMKVTIPGIDKPGVFLAPSASASRGTLREKGFRNADTIARFLVDEKFRQQARDGYIYIDEAPLAGIRQMAEVFDKAAELDARVILQGDRKQHSSVDRGSTFHVLETFAGLPVARLAEIRRQKNQGYRQAVAAIAKGDILGGYDRLDKLGWIEQTPVFDHNKPLVDAYMAAIRDKASVLVVAPTHKEGDEITLALRKRLKEAGIVGVEERTFHTLKPLGWTEAERGDLARYEGNEVIQFVRNSGSHRAGQRVESAEFRPDQLSPEHFAVYAPDEIALAKGDAIRITANGRDKSGKHRLNNGTIYEVAGFTKSGDITLSNGWTIGADFGHFTHGRVVTSHASQGSTVDRVLIGMGSESRTAISAEQFYVSVSRGRQEARIFTNVSPSLLREAIQRGVSRMSATEFMQGRKPERQPAPEPTRLHLPPPKRGDAPPGQRERSSRMRQFVQRVQNAYRQLRMKARPVARHAVRQRETTYER